MNYTEHLKYLENLLGGNSLDLNNNLQSTASSEEEPLFLFNWENYLSNPILSTPALVDEKNPGAYVEHQLLLGEYADKVREKYLENPKADYNTILQLAAESTIYARDKETGEYLHPLSILYLERDLFNQEMQELSKEKKDDFDTLNSLFTHYDDFKSEASEDNEMFQKLKESLKGLMPEEDIQKYWNSATEEQRKNYLLTALGQDLYKNNNLIFNLFVNSDSASKERMLANTYVRNPFYKKLNPWEIEKRESEKKKKEILGDINEVILGNRDIEEVKSYFSDEATHAPWYRVDRYLGGTGLSLATSGILLIENLPAAGIQWGGLKLFNTGNEDLDKRVRALQTEYIDLLADLWIAYWQKQEKDPNSGISETVLANRIDDIARRVSPEFKLNEGKDAVRLGVGDEEELKAKVRLMALYTAEMQVNGEQAAVSRLLDFYKDVTEKNLSRVDVALNAGGQFAANMVADAASFTAVIGTAFYTGLGLIGEGYTDELMHNRLMQWANRLQETGAWSPTAQRKYKELGLNNYQIYKSAEEERSMFSSKLPAELFGLYGFTAATTLLSLGEGWLLNKMVNVTRGRFISGLQKNYVRGKLKLGLLSQEAAQAKIALLNSSEHLASLVAYDRVWGGMFAGGILGTAEGGLEATSTYNNYREANLKPFFNNGEGYIDLMIEQIKNAPNETFIPYMQSTLGFTSDFREGWVNKNRLKQEFKQEDYDKARALVLRLIKEIANDLKDKVEDDALDAAAANFILNSAINGLLKVTLEANLLAGDIRKATKAFKGEKPITDFVDIKKNASGSWLAAAKTTTVKDSWKNLATHPIEAFKDPQNVVTNAVKTGIKGAWGEALEEYSQGISDNISRKALQSDMDRYLKVVFNDEAREAFTSDCGSIIAHGLDGLGAELTNIENIKEGVYGFLSTLFGGVSPAKIITHIPTYVAEAHNRKDGSSAISAYGKALYKSIFSLLEGSVINSYRENVAEIGTSQHLSDAINTWLQNKDAQELMTHLGGAVGFEKSLIESLREGDTYEAHNNKLGLAVENIAMMESLRGTKLYEALRADIRKRLHLGEEIEDGDDTEGEHYDELGRYRGNNEVILSFLGLFKNNMGDVTRTMDMSDKQIIEKIRSNAQEFMNLRLRVLDAEGRIKKTFLLKNVDPLVLKALSYAIISSEDAKDRKDKIQKNLSDRIEKVKRTHSEEKSGLSKNTIDLILQFGSLRKMSEHIDSLDTLISKYRAEKKYAVAKAIEDEKKRLVDLLEVAQNDINKGGTTTLTDNAVFNVADMLDMSIETLSDVISKSKNGEFSKAQLKKVDEFLDVLKQLGGEDVLENIDVNSLLDDFIDWKALSLKSEAYNKYLLDYVNNPRWLESSAYHLRQELRMKSLLFIYKDLFLIRDGEVAKDMLDRVDEKVKQLREQGKIEDSELLNNIKRNNSSYRRYTLAMSKVNKAIMDYVRYSTDPKKGRIAAEVTAFFKTLIENGDITYEAVLDLVKNSNLVEIERILHKGEARFNHNTEGLLGEGENIESFTERTINHCREVILVAEDVLKQLEKKEVKDKEGRPAPEVNPSGVTVVPLNTLGKEPPVLRVTTIGDIDAGKESELHEYLKNNNVDRNVEELYRNPSTRKITLKAVLIGNVWRVIVCNNGKVVGMMTEDNVNASTKLRLHVLWSINNNIRTLNPKGNTEVPITNTLKEELTFDVNNIDNLISTRDSSPESKLPTITKEALNTNGITEDEFIANLTFKANGDNWEFYFEKDGLLYPVRVIESQTEGKTFSVLDLKVVDSATNNVLTVRDILNNTDRSDKQSIAKAIALLSKIEPIKCILDRWLNYKPDGVSETPNNIDVYNNLIGDFIYLGKVKNNNSGDIEVEVTRGSNGSSNYITLSSSVTKTVAEGITATNDVHIPFAIPRNNSSKEERNSLFIGFLQALSVHKDSFDNDNDASYFTGKYTYLQLSTKITQKIVTTGRCAFPYVENYVRALLRSGLLAGELPKNLKVPNFLLGNPFVAGGQGTRVLGGGSSLGAPLFNPPKQGASTQGGATVNPSTGAVIAGNVGSIRQAAKNYIDRLIQSTLGPILSLLPKNNPELNSLGTAYVLDNKNFSRATHAISHLIGLIGQSIRDYKLRLKGASASSTSGTQESATEAQATTSSEAQTGTMSTAFGNITDDLSREICIFLNSYIAGNNGLKLPANLSLTLLNNILKHLKEAFAGLNYISTNALSTEGKAHITQTSAINLIKLVYGTYTWLYNNGFVVIPNDVTVFGSIPIENTDELVQTAGTLDILAYNSNTKELIIVDIKSTLSNNYALANKNAYWRGQLATYKELILQTLKRNNINIPGLKVKTFNLPILLDYTPDDKAVVAANGRTVKKNKDSDALASFTIKDNGLRSNGKVIELTEEVDKILVLFDAEIKKDPDIVPDSIVKSSLTPADNPLNPLNPESPNGGGINVDTNVPLLQTGGAVGPVARPSASRGGSPGAAGGNRRFGRHGVNNPNSGLGPKRSVKTEVQAAQVDFINSRIAPLKTFKVAIVSTIFNFVRKYAEKSTIKNAIINDLAVTFFNGNVNKLKRIVKVDITPENADAIRQHLINYYSAYTQQEDSYKENLRQKHILIRALYDYIDGSMGQEQFEETLLKYNVTASNILEYVEYISAEDKQAAGEEIKKRLKELELYSEEALLNRLKSLEEEIDDMNIKLEFLQRESAAQMLHDRMSSIEDALVKNQINYKSFRINKSIDAMMSGLKYFFNAKDVIQEIVKKSKSRYMKILAQAILEALESKPELIIEIVNSENNAVEGEFNNDRLIRIGKNSLSSYERLERVVLHEAIHAVVKDNAQVKEKLEKLLQQVVDEIKYETGKTEEQIRQDTYGLSNVDEFIAEFFTNYAFLESLKLIADTNTRYNNIFDSIIGTVKNLFKLNVSLWDKINSTMQDVLATQNTSYNKKIEQVQRTEQSEYDRLSKEEKLYLEAGNISPFEYAHLTRMEKDFIKQCCRG